MENGYPIGKELSLVEHFYNMGARYITLCHTRNNDICDSSTDPDGPEYNGLSEFGKSVVKEMNRLGMLIDVSHISDEAFYDVIDITEKPVFASHSCVRSLCDHPRNLDDDMLKRLAENGGVIQICFVSSYLKELDPNPARDSVRQVLRTKYNNFRELSDERMAEARREWFEMERKYPPSMASVSDIVDHIDHVVALVGVDHVGIGTDFDGGGVVKDCFDVSQMENITVEMVRRGYSKSAIQKIWGGNFLRVFEQNQKGATS
jgi:membrane dipeptidase